MNKYFLYLILFIIFNQCSLDTKTGFWTKPEILKEKKENLVEIFKTEEVLEKEKEHIITQIYNPENDWWVSIKYTMVDENTVKCEFSGDSENVSIYKRQYITN